MKRTHILNLKSPIDPADRLEVYREAYERFLDEEFHKYYGFCLGLPIVLWGLSNHSEKAPNGINWLYADTTIAFPELTADVLYDLDSTPMSVNREKLRLEYLAEWIQNLEYELQQTETGQI